MRWNCPPIAAASDFTARVLARPGTPSTSRCPPESKAIAIRSSSTSWPTMVRLTSNSTGCSGLACGPGDEVSVGGGVIELLRPWLFPLPSFISWPLILVRSYLGPLPRPVSAGAAERGTDGYREADAGERVLAVGSGERYDDADDSAVHVEQRAPRTARVDRRVELDEPGELAVIGVSGPVKAGDHPGGHTVGQAERVADGDDRRSHVGPAAEGGRHDHPRQLRGGERGDVQLRVGGGDGRVRRAA